MLLHQLSISSFRNIQHAKFNDLAHLNIFLGSNGSGKTSLLEAIYFLAMARSFRSSKVKAFVNYDADTCLVVAKSIGGETLGIEKTINGISSIRYQGESIQSAAALAGIFPIQLLNEDSFNLLIAGPNERRKFMDWGVFHVEHLFYKTWSSVQRSLKQRNALLRNSNKTLINDEMSIWTTNFVSFAEQLHVFRLNWFEKFAIEFKHVCKILIPELDDISISYSAGWDLKKGLTNCLHDSLELDAQRGFTHYGPHRSDIKIKCQNRIAEEVLSRGQLKIIVAAMKITQTRLLRDIGKETSYLIDDLHAELDEHNANQLLSLLLKESKQVFLTAIDRQYLPRCVQQMDKKVRMFHVEHGVISSAN